MEDSQRIIIGNKIITREELFEKRKDFVKNKLNFHSKQR